MALTPRTQVVFDPYKRQDPPLDSNINTILRYLVDELGRLENVVNDLALSSPQVSDREPTGPRTGQRVYAVSPWDPGSGSNVFYTYDGSNWVPDVLAADLGTAAAEDIGTSGANVPLLNGANTWSGVQTFNTDVNFENFSATGASSGKTTATNSIMDSSRDNTASREHYRFYNPNGQVGSISTSGVNTAFNTTCDGRLKEDLRDFDALAILSQMAFYDFRWISTGERDYGPIAQQLLETFPRAVLVPEGGGPLQYNASALVPVLGKACLQLRAVNAIQTQRILDLEARVAALESASASVSK